MIERETLPPPQTPPLPTRPSSAADAFGVEVATQPPPSRFWPTWCCKPRNAAVVLSAVSILITICFACVGVLIAIITRSAATLGFALESGVDVVSSALIIWRFCGGDEKALERREKRASVLIALTFLIMALVLTTVAVIHLAEHSDPLNADILLGFAIPSTAIFSVLGVLKLVVGCELKSYALRKDAVCSFAAAALSTGVVFSIALFDASDGAVWWFDSAFAIVISACVAVYGTRTLIKNTWWRKDFWCPGDSGEGGEGTFADLDGGEGEGAGYDFGALDDDAGNVDDGEEAARGEGGAAILESGGGGDSV